MPKWISLGAFADLDPTEGNTLSENADDLLGTFDRSQMSFVNSVSTDANGDGKIVEDDLGGGESVTIDGSTSTLDSIQTYNVTITAGDGSVYPTTLGIAQLANGQVYIVPKDEIDLDNLNIQAIQLDSVAEDNFDGMFTQSANRSIDNTNFVCFAAGTMIDCINGPRRVETLAAGDLVDTLDHGPKPLIWVGSRAVRTDEHTRPIRIARHALGSGFPDTDLIVSPQHRVLVRSKIAHRIYGCSDVLIAAKKLVGRPGIAQSPDIVNVSYWHLLFDAHEIVVANGTPAESLYTGPMARAALDPCARDAILRHTPRLQDPTYLPARARDFATGRKLKSFLERHKKNGKPLFNPREDTHSGTYEKLGSANARHRAARAAFALH